jgi:hypothetical protein
MGKRQTASRSKSVADWKKPVVSGSAEEYRYKLKRTALWIGCFLLFAAFVAYLIPPKNTPLVVLRASRYPLQMPPLSLAMEDEAFLKQISPANLPLRETVPLRYFGASDTQSGEEDSRQRFLARLKEVAPSGPGWFSRNDMVIIYISAHGLVNADGQACLVPPNGDAFDSSRWLPLSKLLTEICTLPNLKRSRKLVVLDCNRISTHWRSGVMDNRFADQLPTVVDHVNDPNLYVLNSTSPGQVAWAAPELKGSVFGHFLALGLRGDASHEYPRDRSRGVVSLLELSDYLRSRVNGYVQKRRHAAQIPMLIGPDGLEVTRDIPLVSTDYWQAWRTPLESKSSFDVLGEAKRLIESDTSPLRQTWQTYQQLTTGGPHDRSSNLPITWRRGFVADPVRWASLEQRLLALEERLFAGEEYQAGLGNQFASLHDELSSGVWHEFPETQAVTNLRLARWEQMATRSSLPDQSDSGPGYGSAFEKWLKDPPEEKARFHIPPSEFPRAMSEMLERFGLVRAEEGDSVEPLTDDRLKQVLEFLHLTDATELVPAERVPLEGHFLKLIARGSMPSTERQRTVALQTRSLAEAASTPLDVRAHYALENLVNNADERRRLGEDQLFLGDIHQPQGAEYHLRAARGTASADPLSANGVGYQGAVQRAELLGDMFLLRDEIWARFPYLAEWFFRRSRLALAAGDSLSGDPSEMDTRARIEQQFTDNVNLLTEVLNTNVAFAERLESVLLQRDNEQQLTAELQLASEQYRQLESMWRQLQGLLAEDSRPREQEENAFLAGTSVRNIEQIMHTPLYVGARVEGLLAKYHSTLATWALEELPGREPELPAIPEKQRMDTAEAVFREGYRNFLIQYHKLLTYEFKLPYDQHRATLELNKEDVLAIDQQLRRQKVKDNRSLWQNLRNVFGEYDTAMQAKPVDVGKSSPAVQVRRDLSIWDRRVRTSATWLGCFNQDLVTDPLAIPTPTVWLRSVDHWHLTCWHAHRALEDFWGNGLPRDSSIPYFDIVATRCSRAAQTRQLPFQYDLPGQPVEPLADLQKSRMTAHDRGLLLQLDNVQLLDQAEAKAIPFKATARQLSATVDREPVNFPVGSAGFFITKAGDAPQLDARFVTYGDQGKPHRFPLPLIARTNETIPAHEIPCQLHPTDLGRPPVDLVGNVWYRGHAWQAPFQFYFENPDGGLSLVYDRQSYSPPTVQVRGNDAPTGAIMFVLDCSSSMMNRDDRFRTAHSALSTILNDLRTADKGGMQIGLMAYGHRTPNRAGYFPVPNDKMFYDDTKLATDRDNLTDDGRTMKTLLGDAEFNAKFPHPDRDIEVLYPPGRSWSDELPKRLATLNVNRCFGVTPLYASIATAIREAENVEGVQSRQVIVVSDGVNMPNNCNLGHPDPRKDTIRPNGEIQNGKDFAQLDSALKSSTDVKVRVILFGEPKPGIEEAQLEALKSFTKYPHFELVQIKIPTLIKHKIEEAFVKPTFVVNPVEKDRRNDGVHQFNEIWQLADWPTQGDLISPQSFDVAVSSPRLRTPLQQSIQLSGGESLQLWFETGLAAPRLFFEPDEMQVFDAQKLQPAGSIDAPVKPFIVELVKPDVGEAKGVSRPTTFRLRLRTEANDEFVARPRFVWAEFRPASADQKHQELVYQLSDLRFENKTRTPVMLFPVPTWPVGVDAAEIKLWIRYGAPPSLFPTVRISAADVELPKIFGEKYGMPGVDFSVRQEVKPGTSRQVQIVESHPEGTPLERLYRTRVQLSLPADKIERTYFPDSSRVVHTFTYRSTRDLNADVNLEVHSAEQIKDGSFTASLQLRPGWNR